MMCSRFCTAVIACVVFGNLVHAAETYPTRPIRIVTSPAGGSNDVIARTIAPGLGERMHQQIVIENRPAGVIPGQVVANAQPDGYTLLLTTGVLWISPLMQQTPFDAVKDFAPITEVLTYPSIVVVAASGPNTVKDLIALAEAKPGALNYASGSSGSNTHLTGELFKWMAGVNIVRIPYTGEAPALIGLLGGEAQAIFATGGLVSAQVKAGRLKILAVTSAQPSPLYPGVPTLAASGVPGFESSTDLGLLTRAGTPRSVIKRLNDEIVAVLRAPDVKEKIFGNGYVVVGSRSEDFATLIKNDIEKWSKLVKSAGIRAE